MYRCIRPPRTPNGLCTGGGTAIGLERLDDDVMLYVGHLFTNADVVIEAMQRLRDNHSSEIDQLETILQSIEGRIEQLQDEASGLLATKEHATNPQAQAFLAKRLDDIFDEVGKLSEEQKIQATIAEKWGDFDARISTYSIWSSEMAQVIQQETYQWKRAALAFLGLKVTVWNRASKPRYRINCTLGGVQAYFSADSDEIKALKAGETAIYDMYNSP